MSKPDFGHLSDPELAALLEKHYSGHRVHALRLDLSDKVLDETNLNGAELIDCKLDAARLRRVDLTRSYPTRCSFVGADMTSALLYKAELIRCDLRRARLFEANLTRATCHYGDLRGADLTHADLTRCFFDESDLRGAVLRDTVLRATSIWDCHVADLDLRGASGTLLRHAINVGTPEGPRVLDGDEALAWFRAAGADVTWYVPEPR